MIKLENVYKELSGLQVLRGVTLEVEQGETCVIIGGSGTGKSVTLKHMIGLMHPDQGNVYISGMRVNGASARELRKIRQRMGVLFQSGALLNWMSVAENVALPLWEKTNMRRRQIERIVGEKLELVDMGKAKDKFPSEISGGMKKRAGLARALVNNPDIILYDEPTSGLDPVMSNVINHLVLRLQKELGVTTIVVTHDMTSAYTIANRIAMLYNGRIVAYQEPEQIKISPNRIIQQFINGRVEGPIRNE